MRQLPHSLNAEQQLIATLFRFNETWPSVCNVLKPSDFYLEAHQVIFEHIGKVLEMGGAAEVVTIDESVESLERGRGRDFYLYLHSQFEEIPTSGLLASNAIKLAEVVREKSILRSLIDTCETIVENVLHPGIKDVQLILDNAQGLIASVCFLYHEKMAHRLDNVIHEMMERIGDRAKANTANTALDLETGFAELGKCFHGLQESDLILLTGHPGTAKRMHAMKLVEHLSINAGHPVLIYSQELSIEQLGNELLASRAAIPTRKLRRGELSEQDLETLEVAATDFRNSTVVIFDEVKTLSITELRAQIRRTHRECKYLGLIVIDSLQALSNAICFEDSRTDQDTLLRTLKQLACELSTPILVLAELSSMGDATMNKRPRIADLLRDGINAQWADLVLSFWEDDGYSPGHDDKRVAQFHIVKKP